MVIDETLFKINGSRKAIQLLDSKNNKKNELSVLGG